MEELSDSESVPGVEFLFQFLKISICSLGDF